MKKLFLFLAAAALMLSACQEKAAPEESAAKDGAIRFKIAVDNLTKSSPYTKTTAEDLVIPAVASLYHADGTTILPSVYYNPNASNPWPVELGYLSATSAASDFSYFCEDPNSPKGEFILPLGDVRLDLLAFAMSEEDAASYLSGLQFYYLEGGVSSYSWDEVKANGWESTGDANWKHPVFSDRDNYTKKVEFVNVDTRYYPADVMYASANNLSRQNNVGHLLFKHAGAAVIFNIVNGGVPSGDVVKIKNVLFINPDYDNNGDLNFYQSDDDAEGRTKVRYDLEKGNWPTIVDERNQITLRTVGTLTIDNSRVNLTAKWTLPTGYLSNYTSYMKDEDHYTFDFTSSSISALNVLPGSASPSFQNDPEFYLSTDASAWLQYGNPLMIPVQSVANAYLWYQICNGPSAGYYLYDLNLPRGIWQAGHVYIYNIYPHFTGAKFTIEVEPWEYLASNFNFDYLENWEYLSSGTVTP